MVSVLEGLSWHLEVGALRTTTTGGAPCSLRLMCVFPWSRLALGLPRSKPRGNQRGLSNPCNNKIHRPGKEPLSTTLVLVAGLCARYASRLRQMMFGSVLSTWSQCSMTKRLRVFEGSLVSLNVGLCASVFGPGTTTTTTTRTTVRLTRLKGRSHVTLTQKLRTTMS